MDHLLFEQSNASEITTEPFVNRQVVYVIDQNNGNYTGQIQLDTSSLSNSGKYASYSEAYLEIPLVVLMQPTAAIANLTAAVAQYLNFAVGLKNGFYQLIHSLSCEYNNNSVIQLTPYTNFYVNYKLMTSLSMDDVNKYGQSIGFYPDSAGSFNYSAAGVANADGSGVSNNRTFGYETLYPTNGGNIYADTATALAVVQANGAYPAGSALGGVYTTNLPSIRGGVSTVANFGYYKRKQYCAFNPTFALYNNFTNGTGYATTLLKNYFNFTAGGAGGLPANQGCLQWYILARIRLKDVSDFFDKLPLVKGAYLRFIINTNTSSNSITLAQVAAAAGQPIGYGMYATSAPTLSNGTNPLIIASAQIGQALNPVFYAAANQYNGTYVVNCGICKATSTSGTTFSHTQNACRLYVPLYQLNPTFEEQYLSLNRTKRVVYRDIYQYSVNVSANGTFNNLLTNGIPNPKTVILIPVLQASANSIDNAGAVQVAPHQSPFSSEPGTTSPLIALTNLNIQIAGINQFLQNELYDFEQFVNELAPQNALNGGLVDGLVSGLISEYDYSMMYRYYVCDVSRRLPAEDQVPKSVQILGQNVSNVAITLFVFIEFEKSITIDLITGAKLD
jgi:hypothetical protein